MEISKKLLDEMIVQRAGNLLGPTRQRHHCVLLKLEGSTQQRHFECRCSLWIPHQPVADPQRDGVRRAAG